MLAEVPRQILHFLAELKKLANAMLPEVQTCILKLPRERVLGIRVFPGAHETGQAVQSFRVEGKDFSNFASGGLAAIGDDVRGHLRHSAGSCLPACVCEERRFAIRGWASDSWETGSPDPSG